MVDEVAVALMLDADGDLPAGGPDRAGGLTRLGVRLHEAGDETAILRALDLGLRELRLSGLVGRLESDGHSIQVVTLGRNLLGTDTVEPRLRKPVANGVLSTT